MKMHRLFSVLTIAAVMALVLTLAPAALAQTLAPANPTVAATGCAVTPGSARAASSGNNQGGVLWRNLGGLPGPARAGAQAAITPQRFQAYRLNRIGMTALLNTAPSENSRARRNGLIISLPNPCGALERFSVEVSSIMAPGLAAKHPDIRTFRGVGLDDPAATIRFDITPLGFHASVRSSFGAWYIDPYYHLDDSAYATYFGRDLPRDESDVWVERTAGAAELTIDQAQHRPTETVTLSGSGFAPNATVTITVSDPTDNFASRELTAATDELGMFSAEFMADPDGNLEMHVVAATDGTTTAYASYEVTADAAPDAVNVATGDILRVYRLALITDPGYAAYFGGSANVTPAKVTLINRVDQLYEDDMSIRLVLVGNNDLLNLDTWGQATAPNGPCGSAACFTQSQVTGCSSTSRARYVIGQIIGASNYDIGHLALGQPGGGVANLGVIGRSNKAGGCTGIPTPTGDYYAVDYVAHEMGHQFSGNHPFNGNQLNCSGGNRSAANSTEPGSGSSVMAYAGICLTDDLQAHSDPYFSQRSQQEISNYTSSNQAAINEVQTASLRHFGGGNEVQVVTFGPGYSQAATIQPLSLAINAAPSATSLGGATEDGNTVTIATGNAHTLQVGDAVTIAGVAVAGYNGAWVVESVPTSRSFTYTNPTSGLARSGGGTVTLVVPGATESGTTVTISTAAAHNRQVGDVVTISGVGVSGYNGTVTVTAVPSPRTFQYTAAASGLANSGGGSATYFAPFQVRIGGNDSVVVGGQGLPYTTANLQTAINGIAGFAGTVTVSGAASTGFTVTYSGASAGLDVPNFELVNLACGGCYASVEETNHGGAFDSFTLSYGGNTSTPIVNGTSYTSAGLSAALTAILPAGATFTLNAFGGGNISGLNNTGFQVTFTGALATTNITLLGIQDFTTGAAGWVGETDKGGAVDNKGGPDTVPTGNAIPAVTAPASFTIPLRTPFSLTGVATDGDGDAMIYSWEQNDRGGSAGTSLLNNVKTNGPLFAMFPKSGIISLEDSLLYDSPGENHLTNNPTRVFPDLQQILDNNTNADTGSCPQGPIAPQAAFPIRECYAEFLPTTDYVGFSGVNASPLSLHMRFTARDLRGGSNFADTTLLLANTAGPFLVTSPNTAVVVKGASTQTVTWNVAGTDVAPVSAANVKISLSTDGGYTYPYVLAASTANDGSEAVVLPNVATTLARVKIEAVDNIFFDLSNANFTIQALPVATSSVGEGGSQSVQYSDSLAPDLAVTATDADSQGSALTATASGLPAGLSLAITATSVDGSLPGSRTWKVAGTTTAAPGSYPVTVTVTDETGGSISTSFTIVVTPENADATYTGDMLAFTPVSGSAANVLLRFTVRDSAAIAASGDVQPGDIRNATVTLKEGATVLCGPLSVALINGDLKTGTVSCTVSLPVGSHTIDAVVDNYYTGMTGPIAGTAVVEVAQPNGKFVTGGGYTTVASSAGTYAADPGTRMYFGFYVNYNNRQALQGHENVFFSRAGHVYLIRSRNITGFGVSPNAGMANFRAQVDLLDVTDKSPVLVASDLTLAVTMTDRGGPRTNDTIGVTLTEGNKLVFSSEWDGAKTVEDRVDGGNVVVH